MAPPSNPSRPKRQSKSSGAIRIIGGRWRGRKLQVVERDGLRPTGDRMRETLFNWIQQDIAGARCLDLYAGTGALGLEAASRGAATVTLVEYDALAAGQLGQHLQQLQAADSVQLRQTSAARFLAGNSQPYDIVFVDPPFAEAAQLPGLAELAAGHLCERAWVYLESPHNADIAAVALDCYRVHRERRYGDVCARLLEYSLQGFS